MSAEEFACFLVIHGSPDPRPQAALAELVERHAPDFALCGGGALECQELSLAEQLCLFGKRAAGAGLREVRVVPLFLLPGVHVCEDVPAAVAAAQQTLPGLRFSLSPHLGSAPEILPLLRSTMAGREVDRWILMAHGSRRPGGNQPVETLAQALGAMAAYWAVSPSLATVLGQLSPVVPPCRLGVVTYFLFAGTITDAIQAQLPEGVVLMPPLAPSRDLIRTLAYSQKIA